MGCFDFSLFSPSKMPQFRQSLYFVLSCVLALSLFFANPKAEAQSLKLLNFHCFPAVRTYKHIPASSPRKNSTEEEKLLLSPTEILDQLRILCAEPDKTDRQPNEPDLVAVQKQLLVAVNRLRRLPNLPETLPLEKLRLSLLNTKDFQSETISEVYQILHTQRNEFDNGTFSPFSLLLRKYLTLELAAKNENFVDEYQNLLAGMPDFVEIFLSGDHPEYGPALTDSIDWLTDLGDCVPSAQRLAAFLKSAFGHSNFYFQVSSGFLSHAFHRSIEEELSLNEYVLDTKVRGSGRISGETSITFRPNEKQAEIRLQLTAQMSSNTIGRNGPIRVASTNSGSIWGEKTIFFSEDLFRTTPASARSNLSSRTTGIGADGGDFLQPILLSVAQNQVPKRKPRYDAESRRMAARRLSERLNQEVNPQIAQIFQRYQKELQTPLRESGLFTEGWKFQTTETNLKLTTRVSGSSQPAAMDVPPVFSEPSDVAVRVHQSALNNAAEMTLAGRRIVIEEFVAQLEEKYPKLMQKLKRNEENPITAITFAEKSPVSVLFKDNIISIVVRIDKFEQDEAEHPGQDITVKYRLSAQGAKFVFERAEAPTVFPSGYDPNGRVRIAGRNLAIRNIVMKRLDEQLKETYELSPTELQEQWEGKGLLTPQTALAENGWLALSWLFLN